MIINSAGQTPCTVRGGLSVVTAHADEILAIRQAIQRTTAVNRTDIGRVAVELDCRTRHNTTNGQTIGEAGACSNDIVYRERNNLYLRSTELHVHSPPF